MACVLLVEAAIDALIKLENLATKWYLQMICMVAPIESSPRYLKTMDQISFIGISAENVADYINDKTKLFG